MTTQQQATTTTTTGKKRFVNVGIKYRGFLAHDNKYFDRKCPSCGSIYDSRQVALCAKCNQPLTNITTPAGKPMSFSEGTFYPCLSTKTKERIKESLANRKGAVPITYRFKVFSFMDDKGVLAPPPEHIAMKTGAMVEFVIINHPAEATYFLTSQLKPGFELMHKIYPGYGDTIKVVREPKAKADATIAHDVDQSGNPAPVTPPVNVAAAELDAMQKRIDEIRALVGKAPAQPAAPKAVEAAAPVDEPSFDEGMDYVDDTPDDEYSPF